MDSIKQAKDYFLSSQSTLLIPNKEYGSRKLINVGLNSPVSEGKLSRLLQPAMKSGQKQWVHPPDALTKGRIVYNVKFLGECGVDQPKGCEVVKEAIRKMKFNKDIKRAEGQKPPKVELIISVEGVTIQERVAKKLIHQYPLHRISYCADDKSDNRMFTFIAKAATSDQHHCLVFDSEKCSEEITLTIGQAFDLAYRRFLESSNKDIDMKKQFLTLQKKVQALQRENDSLKKRITELEQLKDKSEIDMFKQNNQIFDLHKVSTNNHTDESSTDDIITQTENDKRTTVGRQLENLLLDSTALASPKTKSTPENAQVKPVLSPPPPTIGKVRGNSITSPVIQPAPSWTSNGGQDPFGMEAFNPTSPGFSPTSFNNITDQDLQDKQSGFSRGLSFGTDDFSLGDLDPLSNRL